MAKRPVDDFDLFGDTPKKPARVHRAATTVSVSPAGPVNGPSGPMMNGPSGPMMNGPSGPMMNGPSGPMMKAKPTAKKTAKKK